MKILTKESIYIQKSDLIYMIDRRCNIPSSILNKMCEQSPYITNEQSWYDFLRFDKPEEIEFLNNLEWVIDYDEVKDLTSKEIESIAHTLEEIKEEKKRLFFSYPEYERYNHFDIAEEYDFIKLKLSDLSTFYLFQNGTISFPLPENIEYPKYYKKPNILKRLQNNLKKASI